MLYLNTKYLVVFANPMDNSTFHCIARKQDPEHTKELATLFSQVSSKYRYILCDGDINTQQCLPLQIRLVRIKWKREYAIKGSFT